MNEIEKENKTKETSESTVESVEESSKFIKILKKILAVVVILVLIFSPYLLVLDFRKYLPFVVTVWIISAAYYMFVKSKNE